MDIVWKIFATLGLVALNGFFVAAEFAAVGARLSKLESQSNKSLLNRLSRGIKHKLDLYLSTCQLGITIASLGLGYITEPAVAGLLEGPLESLGFHAAPGTHHWIAIAIALGISTSLHVVVGEVAPKNLAIFYPDRILPIIAVPLSLFTAVFFPFIWLLNSASNLLLKLVGVPVGEVTHGEVPHTTEELRRLVGHAIAAGSIGDEDADLIVGAFEFNDLKARQIMTPRPDVDYLLTGQPINEILHTAQHSEYTRLPLCDDDLDHVVGLIHMKDLFASLKLQPGKLKVVEPGQDASEAVAVAGGAPGSEVHVIGAGHIDLAGIRRDILFVPELLPAMKLLRQFQESAVHMAIVVDEYGATQGIITLEDVLEQIVGDITDEFDETKETFAPEGENFRLNGAFPLHELRDRLQLKNLPNGDVDTVGGFITQELGRWARAGDVVPIGPYDARVVTIEDNRPAQVLLTPTGEERENDER